MERSRVTTRPNAATSRPGVYACFNAPWYFDGKRVTKLSDLFPSNVTAQASAINDAFQVAGNGIGAWVYSGGAPTYTGNLPNNTSLFRPVIHAGS